jgi:ABC-type nitrate/sulfonate/bicarbonate transport system substrate-binding protein
VVTRLSVGAFSPSVLLRVARRTGRLDACGLVVDETPVTSSVAQFQALLAGALDAVLTSPDNVVAYRYTTDNPLGRTADVRIVAAVDRGLGLALYGRPGLTTPADLRGATIGVDVATSGFALAMYAAAESIGLRRADYHVVALGATPRRLVALLAGGCAATMLNAGNELRAERAGCAALVRVVDVCAPYLGTVLAVTGDAHVDAATRLAGALRETAGAIIAGDLDEVAADEAASGLDLPPELARRYVERLTDRAEGLVGDGRVEPDALRTVVELRRRYLPGGTDGVDPLADALAPGSGLLTAAATTLGPTGADDPIPPAGRSRMSDE